MKEVVQTLPGADDPRQEPEWPDAVDHYVEHQPVDFLSQQQLVEAILAAQLFVLASSRDASPKAMSEALYLRKPVVCSDHVGTSKDLIEPGRNGFIYPCGDVAALAGYTARILDDEATRRGMGEHSHEIARRNDFPAGVESLVAKLDELAGVGGRRP